MLNVTLEQAAPGSLGLHDVRNEVPRRAARVPNEPVAWLARGNALSADATAGDDRQRPATRCSMTPLRLCDALVCRGISHRYRRSSLTALTDDVRQVTR